MALMDDSELREELRRRSLRNGGGLLPLGGFGATTHTGWIVRRHDAQIRLIRSSEETVHELRAGDWEIKLRPSNVKVRVAAMAIAIGFRPFDEDDVNVSFINEYGEAEMCLLEHLTTQEQIPLVLLGDSRQADINGTVDNVHREWAKRTLAAIQALPRWSERDFERARAKVQGRFSNRLKFWHYLGHRRS